MTAVLKDAGAASAGRSGSEDESSTDLEWEDIDDFYCVKHGMPMTVDFVMSRDLRACKDQELLDPTTMLRVGFCKFCCQEARADARHNATNAANATRENDSKKKKEDEAKLQESQECRHLESCRGANQYGRWTICKQCGARLSYQSAVQGYPKLSKKSTSTSSTSTSSTTCQAKIDARRKELKEKLQMKDDATTTTTSTTPNQARFITLLCAKLGVHMDVPSDRIEASVLIDDLRSEIRARALWT